MSSGEFSVWKFFDDGLNTPAARFISSLDAVNLALECLNSDDARRGRIMRVIITDGADMTNFEWRYCEGIVYPTMPLRIDPNSGKLEFPVSGIEP